MTPEFIITAFVITWAAIAFVFGLILRHMSTCNSREREMGKLMEGVDELKRAKKDPR